MIQVKTTYTVEEFASYLAHGVLRDSAEPLGWGPIVSYTPAGIETKTVASNTNATPSVLTLSTGLTNALPAGATVINEDGDVALTLNNESAGATVIEIDINLTVDEWAAKKVAFVYRSPIAEVPNPKFIPVVDEALRQMGLEDIEQINATNVRELRIRGRLELLRRIAEDRTYQYDYTNDFNVDGVIPDPHSPSVITAQMMELYQDELTRLMGSLDIAAPLEPTVEVTGIPPESLSKSTGVGIRW